jgi:WD40 repeat protein
VQFRRAWTKGWSRPSGIQSSYRPATPVTPALHPDNSSWCSPKAPTPNRSRDRVVTDFPRTRETRATDPSFLRVWDLRLRRVIHRLQGHTDEIACVQVSPCGTWIASGGWDDVARVWDLLGGVQSLELVGHTSTVESISFSPDSRWLATGSWDESIKLWSAADGVEVQTLVGHTHNVLCVQVAPTGQLLASGGKDGTVRLWGEYASPSNR